MTMKPMPMIYNPAFLLLDELIRQFVVRQADLDSIIEVVAKNSGSANQHILVIAPRGMGKTMLVLRAAAHIARDNELSRRWYPLVFSEESYEVSTAAEFWLRAVFHLGRQVKEQTKDDRYVRLHEQLAREKDEKRLYEQALSCLLDFADSRGKRILMVVENINMLLDEQIGRDQGWDLRHTMQNEPRLMILATAPARFDGIDNAGMAMYDLFAVHTLEPLDAGESRVLWESLTGRQINEEKIRPIRILTGGNPRLLAIISSFAVGATFRELMKQLAFLIDEYTTYFKSNIESLPPLERKVFVTLANIWEPTTTARAAAEARLDINKTSSLLKRLESRGIVQAVKERPGKKSYQLCERLYNIYHLMRLSGGQADRVRAVVDFMVNFYEGEELSMKMAGLAEEAIRLAPQERLDHVAAYKEVLQRIKDSDTIERIIQATKPDFLQLPEAQAFLGNMLNRIRPAAGVPLDFKLAELPDQELDLRKIIEIDPQFAPVWGKLGQLLHDKLARYEEAEQAYRKAIEIDPKYKWAWAQLGVLLHDKLARYEEAESAYRKAIEIDPQFAPVWGKLGQLLHARLTRYEEAESAYRKAIEIDPKLAPVWGKLGQLLHDKLARYEEAESAYRKAIEIDPQFAPVWGLLGILLHERLTRYEEAEQAYRKAIEIDPQLAPVWGLLGILLHERLTRYEEAESAYRKAIEIDPKYAWAWSQLGKLLHEKLERYGEAEQAYLKAIEIDPKFAQAWALFGVLLHEKLDRYDKAEQAYRKAIKIDPQFAVAWVQLGKLLHEKLARYEEAESAYRKAVEIDPHDARTWALLGGLFHDNLARYDEAEQAYRKAIEIDPQYDWAWGALLKLQIERSAGLEKIEETIALSLEKTGASASILDNIAWAIFTKQYQPLYHRAEEYARAALDKEPGAVEYRYIYASLLGAQGKWPEALSAAAGFLENTDVARDFPNDIISFFSDAAAAGYEKESLKILAGSACAPLMEPLIVALQMLAGEDYNAPREVVEVALDVRKRIEERKKPAPKKDS